MNSIEFSFPFPWVAGSEFANAVVYTGLLMILEVMAR